MEGKCCGMCPVKMNPDTLLWVSGCPDQGRPGHHQHLFHLGYVQSEEMDPRTIQNCPLALRECRDSLMPFLPFPFGSHIH